MGATEASMFASRLARLSRAPIAAVLPAAASRATSSAEVARKASFRFFERAIEQKTAIDAAIDGQLWLLGLRDAEKKGVKIDVGGFKHPLLDAVSFRSLQTDWHAFHSSLCDAGRAAEGVINTGTVMAGLRHDAFKYSALLELTGELSSP